MLHKTLTELPDREILEELGIRLRALRQASGLTVQEAAERAGLDRGTVGRAERGANPTVLTLVRLLRVYGRLGALEHFVPSPELSPIALLKKGRRRG